MDPAKTSEEKLLIVVPSTQVDSNVGETDTKSACKRTGKLASSKMVQTPYQLFLLRQHFQVVVNALVRTNAHVLEERTNFLRDFLFFHVPRHIVACDDNKRQHEWIVRNVVSSDIEQPCTAA